MYVCMYVRVLSCRAGRDQDVLLDCGWYDEEAVAQCVGDDGRIKLLVLQQKPLKGACRILAVAQHRSPPPCMHHIHNLT